MSNTASRPKFQIHPCTMWGGNLHFHDLIEILILQEGEAEVWLDRTPKILKKGEIAIALSFDAHRFRALCDPCRATLIRIPPTLCEEFVAAVQNKTACNHFVRDPIDAQKMQDIALTLQSSTLNEVEQIGYIHLLLGTALRHLEFEQAVQGNDLSLPAHLLSYIDAHYREEFSVEKIAQSLGYNANYVSKCFHSCFHTSISRYVNTLRLKHAALLLKKGKKNISECALESGFGSVRTFYRIFEQEFDCSPREYRDLEKRKK